ncbi:hypothetical protein AB0I10_37285, partial [Streptomyces sp. NPDC050636]
MELLGMYTLLDYDPAVVGMSSQPLWLFWSAANGSERQRTAANGSERQRTAANGSERQRTA